MASTRKSLQDASVNVSESMGARESELAAALSPVPAAKDVGRERVRGFGRIDVQQVMADPGQPREVFSEEGLEQLARSLEEKGQLSPIRVRWSDEQKKWIIIAGERRYRATLRAGLPTIECYFHEGDMTHSEILEQQLIENCLREDLLPIEEARAFEQLRQLNGWTQKELAQALRVSASRVTRVLALLKLAPMCKTKSTPARYRRERVTNCPSSPVAISSDVWPTKSPEETPPASEWPARFVSDAAGKNPSRGELA